jgi:ribosomal protein S12 methylthiotransferase
MKSTKKKPSVCMVSLGCSKNQVDAERALGFFQARDFKIIEVAEEADIVVVNTCAFIHAAEEEAVNALLEAVRLKSRGRARMVLAAGCLVSRYGEAKLKALIPELDGAVLPGAQQALADKITAVFPAKAPRPRPGRSRLLLSGPGSAYLKIAEGCSRTCAYCLIPALRGPLHSEPLEGLVREARGLIASGVKELILVAQDTTAYGRDLAGRKPLLTELLDRLVRLRGAHWIRLMYAYPDGISDGLIQRLASQPVICKYLDIPVQHASRPVLRRMGRAGDGDSTLRLLEKLRARVPGIVIRTTLLTGFPGETEQDHKTLLDFIRTAQFDRLGVFAYSREQGTAAAAMDRQVPWATRERRRRELMAAQAGISRQRLAQRVGQVLECLVEEPSGPDHVIGRTYGDAPEVDGAIILAGWARPGALVKARVTAATDHDLTGEIL